MTPQPTNEGGSEVEYQNQLKGYRGVIQIDKADFDAMAKRYQAMEMALKKISDTRLQVGEGWQEMLIVSLAAIARDALKEKGQ